MRNNNFNSVDIISAREKKVNKLPHIKSDDFA